MESLALRCACGGVLAAVAAIAACRSSPLAPESEPMAPRLDRSASPSAGDVKPPAPRRDDDADDPPALNGSSQLDDYLRFAAMNDPGLKAKFHEWKAALERLPQVRALPDPQFTYGFYIGEVETRVGPMQQTVSFSQRFPWFGTLQDRQDAAAREATAAHQRLEDARLALFLQVEEAYNELHYLRRAIEITRANIELLQRIEQVARARYRVAAAAHPDVIRIQVELGEAEDRLRRLEQLRRPRTARLNAALNRPSAAPLPWPSDISKRTIDVDVEHLLAAVRERNPELMALQEEVEAERVRGRLARKDGLPDFTVGLGYTEVGDREGVDLEENGDDALLASLTVAVPLWRSKYEAGVREAVARRLAAANRRHARSNRLAVDLQEAVFEHEDARRRIELYQGTLIPKSRESLQASLASFEQGETDFLDVLDTERTLLEFQLGLERALVDRATSAARIERLTGGVDVNRREGRASPENAS